MNKKKTSKKKSISFYLFTCFVAITGMAILAIAIFTAIYSRSQAKTRVIQKLEVALEVVKTERAVRDGKYTKTVESLIETENVGKMIRTGNEQMLERIINEACSLEDGYYAILSEDGTVIQSTAHPSGSKWPLAYLLDWIRSGEKSLSTTEMLGPNDISDTFPSFRKSVSIQGVSEDQLCAILRLSICPVYDNGEFEGAFVGGYPLNNNTDITSVYTQSVPDSYLSVGTITGLRVLSNITFADYKYVAGSVQLDEKMVETIKKNERWRGQVYVAEDQGDKGFVVADPITNAAGEVIGSLGVGSPLSLIPGLGFSGVVAILFLSIIVLIMSAVIIRFVSQAMIRPITDLQDISRIIKNGGTPPEVIIWSGRVPLEVDSLSKDMIDMARNITAEKAHLEIKVEERTEHLRQTILDLEETNQYKSQFLANISHELRTPLNSILGFASMLQDEVSGSLNDDQKKYIKVIMDSSNHLMDLINDLLKMIKLERRAEKLNAGDVAVDQLIRNVVDSMKPIYTNKNQTLSLDIPDDSEALHAVWDEKKIIQVMLNLLSNAIKFTPEGGHIAVVLKKNGTDYYINVLDNGIGIADQLKEKVFLYFEQGDESYTKQYQGVGLGLAISRNIVQMHGGSIWLEDSDLGGTNVCVRLPGDALNPTGACTVYDQVSDIEFISENTEKGDNPDGKDSGS